MVEQHVCASVRLCLLDREQERDRGQRDRERGRERERGPSTNASGGKGLT